MKIITLGRNLVIGAAILLLMAAFIASAQEVFEPSDDAMVSRGDPNANYGTGTDMVIRNRYGHPSHPDRWECYLFIRFDLSSIPLGSPIESARLHLYLYRRWDSDPTGRNLNIYAVKKDWDENTITFANQPVCPADSSGYARVPPNNTWMAWDVTEEVQAFVNQTLPNYGWKIMDNTRWGDFDIPMMYFYSKEFGSAIPYLEIEIGTANQAPTAVIDHINPNPASQNDMVSFGGYGTDADGFIVAYRWSSSLDGRLSSQPSFSTHSLSLGTHTIYFMVQDNNGTWSEEVAQILEIEATSAVPGRNGAQSLPSEHALYQNYPNPFNAVTEISYDIPHAENVSLRVLNVLGQEVAVLVNESQPAGVYRIRLDATGLPSGIYFCQLTTGSYSDCRKMVLLK